MSIKLVISNKFTFPVSGFITAEDGKSEKFQFRLTAERTPADEIEKSVKEDRNLKEFLTEKVSDWSGVKDETGKEEIPFGIAEFEQLLALPGMPLLVWQAYLANVGARAKN